MDKKEYKCPICTSPLTFQRENLNGNGKKEEHLDEEWTIKLTCKTEKCGFKLTLSHKKELV